MAVQVKVATATLATSGDTTISSDFGSTPQACIVIVCNAGSGNTNPSNAWLSIGFYDGTRTRCMNAFSEDGTAAATTANAYSNTTLIRHDNNAAQPSYYWTPAFSGDDLVLTHSGNTPADNHYVTVIFFTGCKNAYVNNKNLNGTTVVDVTDPGFKPTLLFSMEDGFGAVTSSLTWGSNISFGVAHCNSGGTISQQCMYYGSNDAALNMAIDSGISAVRANRVLNAGKSINVHTTLSDFDASGFSIVGQPTRTETFCYLAIELDDPDQAYADAVDTSTDLSAIGFAPIAAGIFGSTHTTFDYTGSTPSSGMTLFHTDGTTSTNHIITDEDGTANANAKSRYATGPLAIYFDDNTIDAQASAVTLGANGLTWSWSDSPAATRKILVWAIGADTAATTSFAPHRASRSFQHMMVR